MTLFLRWVAACALFVALAACATKPAIPYDRSSSNPVKKIGIVTPEFPEGPHALLASSVGMSFGLIGALIDAGMEANRDSSLDHVLAAQNFAAYQRFVDGLTASLKAQGYEVEMISVTRPKKGEFLKTYPTGEKVDAYLDIVAFNYGYVAAGVAGSTPYRPFLYTQCQLVRASDNSVLMQDQVDYNPINVGSQSKDNVTIGPDPAYSFEKFSDLEGDPAKATKGVEVAFAQTTDAIGKLLR